MEITAESLLATRLKSRAMLDFIDSDRAILGWPDRGMFIRRTAAGDLIGEAFCGATFFSAVRPPIWVLDGATHGDYGCAIVVPVTPEMIEKEKHRLDGNIRRLKAMIEAEKRAASK